MHDHLVLGMGLKGWSDQGEVAILIGDFVSFTGLAKYRSHGCQPHVRGRSVMQVARLVDLPRARSL